jgi:glycosyltransferase involved in cell wall biosynthesis
MDLSPSAMRRATHSWDLYWYYLGWQRLLARNATRLHAEVGFDIAHHVTFANDWMFCGLSRLDDVPFVWGPIGGATRLPLHRVARWLGSRGMVFELVRNAATWLPRSVWGHSAARRASVVVAQNADVARHFRFAAHVVVEPNAALGPLPARPAPDPARSGKTAVFAGRLIGLKAPRLALATLARPEVRDWNLEVYGDGYERRHLERLAHRLGISSRVRFHGFRPRAEVLEAYAHADALLFPSLHDQAGWAVAEASSIGCPVVCLPLGGPPLLAAPNGHVASLSGDIPANLAAALVEAARVGGVPHSRWTTGRLPELVDGWYALALEGRVRDLAIGSGSS